MTKIINYIEKNLKLSNFNFENDANYNDIKNYYNNAKADAIYCFEFIKRHLDKNKKILEVGGGAHLLTGFLKQEYDITSIEPGGFRNYIDELRNKICSKNNLKVHTTTIENFNTDEKFDLIFSMNVLEHVDSIEKHLSSCINLLRDENSLLLIQCPNYTFPFECHFYKWFIPFAPNFTFKYLKKKRLIGELGEEKYNDIINSLNFNCTYFNIKNLKLSVNFTHPLKNIFDRMEADTTFKNRLCQNSTINLIYKLINLFKIKNLLINFYPKFFSPYLIMHIKKTKS